MNVTRTVIKNKKQFLKLVEKLKKSDKISFDTEFVDDRYPELELVGMSFCVKEKENYYSYYIPINHKNMVLPIQQCKDLIIKKLKLILEDENKLIIMHNAKAEIKICWLHGIYIQDAEYFNSIFNNEKINYEVPKRELHIFDTMLASWISSQNMYQSNGLKELTKDIYNKDSPHFKDIAFRDKKAKKWRIDLGDFKKVSYYACEDAINTYRLYEHFNTVINNNEKLKKLQEELELQQMKVLCEMEIYGMPADKNKLKKIGKKVKKELIELKNQLYNMCGTTEINLNSMQQLNYVFFKLHKLKPKTKKGKNGFYPLNKTVLILFAKEGVEIAKTLLKYRGLTKLNNTYVDGLIPKITKENKMHGNFFQAVTRTHRLSSGDPNLQNLPGNSEYPIRSIFKSPKGYKWICLDYNQLELRIASHYGNDKEMIEAFISGRDIHGQIAKMSYGLDCEVNEVKEKYPDVRKRAKQLSFGGLNVLAEIKSTQNRETRNVKSWAILCSKYHGVNRLITDRLLKSKINRICIYGRQGSRYSNNPEGIVSAIGNNRYT